MNSKQDEQPEDAKAEASERQMHPRANASSVATRKCDDETASLRSLRSCSSRSLLSSSRSSTSSASSLSLYSTSSKSRSSRSSASVATSFASLRDLEARKSQIEQELARVQQELEGRKSPPGALDKQEKPLTSRKPSSTRGGSRSAVRGQSHR